MAKVLIFAGANGSGKTTLARQYVPRGMPFVNADEIQAKERLSDIDAGLKSLRRIDNYIQKRADFAFETTMSGRRLLQRFEQLKKRKYYILIYYLFVHPIALLSDRIRERVKKGGHDVAEKDIVRRYYRSVGHFWYTYRFYADEWVIYNNNNVEYKDLVFGHRDFLQVRDETEFVKFKEVLAYEKKKK